MNTNEDSINLLARNDASTEINKIDPNHNPGLRALLAIKNISATLEKDYADLLQCESELDGIYINGIQIIEQNTTSDVWAKWQDAFQVVKMAILGINNSLVSAKKRIDLKEKDGYTELWNQLTIHLTALKDNFSKVADLGIELLPITSHPQWDTDFVTSGKALIKTMVSQVGSYRVLLQMIERYTPEELQSINQLIITQVPTDFTYEETVEYKNDYYQALVNFKAEFKEEKNLWDTFLDILAGGTHQSPAERVMMERWVEGEKEEMS